MKKNYKIFLLAIIIAFVSCNFTTKTFENSDKDKLLLQLISYVLSQGHFNPKDVNDSFSEEVFEDFLNHLDPFKRYFYLSDIEEFSVYKHDIDNQIKDYNLTFFDLTYERLLKRIEDSKSIYTEILATPFNFTINETFSEDYKNLNYVTNKLEMKERWRKQLKFSTIINYDGAVLEQNMDIKNSTDIYFSEENETDTLEKKSDINSEVEARSATKQSIDELYDYLGERQRKDWFSLYLNTIVERFDPHTFYFAPEVKDRFDVAMSGNFEGIGARLHKKMGAITVNELISGGPAWRANELEVGDQILKVRQEDAEKAVNIVGMRLDDAIKLIKGPKGTVVILTLKKVDGTIEDISITRDVVELEETYAKSSVVKKEEKTFGVINLPKFYINFEDYKKRNAASDVKKEIERLKKAGVEGLVLDLRNNGGGSLKTVVDIVGLFIEEGPVVQVKSAGRSKEILNDSDKSIIWNGPLVVLVNELSASASEILAAAMQDYKRAIIIGSKQTYGKGTVQNVYDLNRMVRNSSNGDVGALKLTTQKFYRINGGSTQLEGVKSDIVVPDKYSYIDIGEKDLDNPLPWDKIAPANYKEWQNYFDFKNTIKKSKIRLTNNEQLKLINDNAKWIKKMRDKNIYSLNYITYKKEQDANEKEAERFKKLSDYTTNLTFNSLPNEIEQMAKDTILRQKRERWHENLSRDVYIEEALNVLSDIEMAYTVNNKLVSTEKMKN